MISFLVNGPLLEPVEVEELRQDLRLDGDDDLLLSSLITSARILIEANIGVRMISQSWDIMYDGWPTNGAQSIKLPYWPISDITGIYTLGNGRDMVDSNIYESELSQRVPQILLRSGFSWPVTKRRQLGVLISVVAGFGNTAADVPEPLKQAIRFLATYWYESRDWQSFGVGKKIPDIVQTLLLPYKKMRI